MQFSKTVVKFRIPILILTVVLMIPSVIGMVATRVNYDMLNYLPGDMETVVGQKELLKDFIEVMMIKYYLVCVLVWLSILK